jgi:hypothetical protein
MLHTNLVASFHLLTFQTVTPKQDDTQPTQLTQNLPTVVEQLLNNYLTVFKQPHGLPPSRPHDHRIPLLPNTSPVNVKPYRYPHSQKEAMTEIIRDML